MADNDGPERVPPEVEAFLRLVQSGRGADVTAKLAEQKDLISKTEGSGRTALHFAAYNGDASMTKLLLEHGADAQAEDFDGNTALGLAAKVGKFTSVSALLAGGADVNHTSPRGATAVHQAAVGGNIEMLQTLKNAGAKITSDKTAIGTPLHWAIHKGEISPVAFVLDEMNCPLDAVDENDGTVLHHAISMGHSELVTFLLERGSNPNAVARGGATPLHLTVAMVQDNATAVEIVKQLLLFGANIVADEQGETPLAAAQGANRSGIVKELQRKNTYEKTDEKKAEEMERFKAQGNKVFAASEYSKAARFYSLAIALSPKNHVLFSNRSACHFNLRRFDRALADGAHCVALSPKWAKGYFRKGAALSALGRLADARATYEAGLKLEPQNKDLLAGVKELAEKEAKAPK